MAKAKIRTQRSMCTRCEYNSLSTGYPIREFQFYCCNLKFLLTGQILRTNERSVPIGCPLDDPFISSVLDEIEEGVVDT